MRVGIVGSGRVGLAIAGHAHEATHEVMVSHRGDPDAVRGRLPAPGIQVGTVPDVAAFGEVVFLAVPWDSLPDATAQVSSWAGKVVVDPSNPFREVDGQLQAVPYDADTSSEVVAGLVPGAQLVKGFCTHLADTLTKSPRVDGWRRVILLAGDDKDAKLRVAHLTDAMGFDAIDTGGLVEGGRLFQVGGWLRDVRLRGFADPSYGG